ncbi:hypothetical protein [Micromonospora cathayae]|uniref:Integral membrane protein n=1 Tax=Micromonospora cathayae TaxID=3028804 RepID=A0ABY7ZLD7_9ACTN|nr:hypothetical protein [Micromonospora sp. HUAS 3]WDZ83261.1 hypothetical protein PVK37_22755 [Micromonospora sp. HUAS 3]
MSQSPPTRHWAIVVALLTVLWLVAALLLLGWLVAIGLEGWADRHGDDAARAREIGRRGSAVLLSLYLTVAGGPVVVAVVAFAGRLVRTATVYLSLALVLGAGGLPIGADAARDLRPPPPPVPAGPGGCQEHSGGDTRCPGG